MAEISQRGGQGLSDLIVQLYGFAEGPLPLEITTLFRLHNLEEAYGIVMRLEGGGSLELLLHPPAARAAAPLATGDKLRLLAQIAHGIAELHTIGVTHGDLKPDNILLKRDEQSGEIIAKVLFRTREG